jgi:hypothetical protein
MEMKYEEGLTPSHYVLISYTLLEEFIKGSMCTWSYLPFPVSFLFPTFGFDCCWKNSGSKSFSFLVRSFAIQTCLNLVSILLILAAFTNQAWYFVE